MARNIGPELQEEFTSPALSPVILLKMSFDSGPLRLWTGYGTLTYNGEDYLGTGTMLTISTVDETAELSANSVTFNLSGCVPALVELALGENYQNRPCIMYIGALDQYGSLIGPYQHFAGRMDVMVIADDPANASISLTVENVLADLERPRLRNYTPEDQAIENSGDTIFDHVASLQDTNITWGRS